jgi:hypothetical protein
MNMKGWQGYWQGLHYPTIEEIISAAPVDPEWELMLCTQIRRDQIELYARLKGEIEYA